MTGIEGMLVQAQLLWSHVQHTTS